MDWEKSVIEDYSFVEENGKRHANITIRDGKFEACGYGGLSAAYSLEDWNFLKKVADKIFEVAKICEEKK